MYNLALRDYLHSMTPDSLRDRIVKVYEPLDVLPKLPPRVFLDFETTSFDPSKTSLNPHRPETCGILGVAFLLDGVACYVPVQHTQGNNVAVEKVHDWLQDQFENNVQTWINHHVKYDMHVLHYNVGVKPKAIEDTLTLYKMRPATEVFAHDLTSMSKVFGLDISFAEERLKSCLGKSKDYGDCPIDIMAIYAALDVIATEWCYLSLRQEMRDAALPYDMIHAEHQLTPMLAAIEQSGIRVNRQALSQLATDSVVATYRALESIKHISGYTDFDPSRRKSILELFTTYAGLAIDFSEDTGNPIMGKKELIRLINSERAMELVTEYIQYNASKKLLTAFALPYITEHVGADEIVHGSFNQLVSTGRMSGRKPNLQQLNTKSKAFVIPHTPDHVLVNFDYSQIEFRVIAHYIGNRRTIEAYNADRKTDYHTWVAQLCGVERSPAKTINFLCGYGGGQKRCVAELSWLSSFRKVHKTPERIVAAAEDVYRAYHAALPELNPTKYSAQAICEQRGYVKTFFGTRRYLDFKFCYKAFNSVCQGTAAYMQKLATLRLQKFISPDCLLHALVHDSWLFSIHKNRLDELVPAIQQELEQPVDGFSVPIVADVKTSSLNWAQCA